MLPLGRYFKGSKMWKISALCGTFYKMPSFLLLAKFVLLSMISCEGTLNLGMTLLVNFMMYYAFVEAKGIASTHLLKYSVAAMMNLWPSCEWVLIILIIFLSHVENGHGTTMFLSSCVGECWRFACFWHFSHFFDKFVAILLHGWPIVTYAL